MDLYIPDFVIYIIAVLSMIIVLIMMSNLERKRIKEEKSKNVSLTMGGLNIPRG